MLAWGSGEARKAELFRQRFRVLVLYLVDEFWTVLDVLMDRRSGNHFANHGRHWLYGVSLYE